MEGGGRFELGNTFTKLFCLLNFKFGGVIPALIIFVKAWGGRGGNKKPEVKLNTPPTPLMFSKFVLTIVYETEG